MIDETSASILAKIVGDAGARVAVVVVTGVYRSGKSFLLNKLVEHRLNGGGDDDQATKQESNGEKPITGFKVGHTVTACTMGIWFYDRPIPCTFADGSKGAAILMDSEGMGATNKSSQYDNQLFMLSSLLSSSLVYNSVGTINEKSIHRLTFVGNLVKLLKENVASKEDDNSQDLSADIAPTFVWVLRDFALELVNAKGKAISSDEYMEDALKKKKGFDSSTMQRNKTCAQLKKFFTRRKCSTLVRPASDEKVLQNLSSQPDSALRKKFLKELAKLRRVLFEGVQPKCVGGVAVSGAGLVALLRTYVDAINGGSVPLLRDAWSAAKAAQLEASVNAATSVFKSKLAEIMSRLPMDGVRLETSLSRMKDDALASIPDATHGVAEKMSTMIDESIEHATVENKARSEEQCRTVFDRLWNELETRDTAAAGESGSKRSDDEDGKRIKEAVQRIWSRLQTVRTTYFQQCRGPSLVPIFVDRIETCVKPSIAGVFNETDVARETLLGRIAQEEHKRDKLAAQLSTTNEELGRSRAKVAKVETIIKERDAELVVANETIEKKTEDLLETKLHLDKRTAEVESQRVEIETLNNSLAVSRRETTQWKAQHNELKVKLEASDSNARALRVRLENVRSGLGALRIECRAIRSKQEDAMSWMRAQFETDRTNVRSSLTQLRQYCSVLQSKLSRQEQDYTKEREMLRERVEGTERNLEEREKSHLDTRKELEKATVLLKDERAETSALKERFAEAMRRAESAESKLERLEKKMKRVTESERRNLEMANDGKSQLTSTKHLLDETKRKAEETEKRLRRIEEQAQKESKRHLATVKEREEKHSKSIHELRKLQQDMLVSLAISKVQSGKSVVKYHSHKNKKAPRWLSYNSATSCIGWCNSSTPKPTHDKISIRDVLRVDYGPFRGTFLSRAKGERPWCTFTIVTKVRSYNFAAKSDMDAIDVVSALRELSGKGNPSRGHLLWNRTRLRLDEASKRSRKSKSALIVDALKSGGVK